MEADIRIEKNAVGAVVLTPKGRWTKNFLAGVSQKLKKFLKNREFYNSSITLDFSKVRDFDSAGMVLIVRYINFFVKRGCSVSVVYASEVHKKLLIFHRKNFRANKILPAFLAGRELPQYLFGLFAGYIKGAGDFLVFVGQVSHFLFLTMLRPKMLRLRAIVRHIELSGVRALPIVSLTSFLVGLVVAYQGAEQLHKFGANIFIVEMISISMFRELAPMITAIVIAGRSASAYTAEIGTMKITEEIDAMKTMDFEPTVYLVIPRMAALMISLPLIVFFADMVGVYGGMIVSDLRLDIPYDVFIDRMYEKVHLKHIMIGLIKAPIFGMVIAAIGCFRGFQVTGSTDSIGRYTTISVVNAIFWVIALNALFSILLTETGI